MKIIGTIIHPDEFHVHLDQYQLEPSHREELLEVIEEALYHKFMDVLLTDLSREDRVFVLEMMESRGHSVVIEYVKEKKPSVGEDLHRELHGLKEELIESIKTLAKEI